MRNKESYDYLIRDILIFTSFIIEELKVTSESDFIDDVKTQLALERALHNIGEAAKNLPEEAFLKYSKVEWSEIIKMRDFLAHHYREIQLERIWSICVKSIPLLDAELRRNIDFKLD